MRNYNAGAEYEVPDHYDDAGGAGYYTTMGSIMVKPGCTLYMYSDTGARAKQAQPARTHYVDISTDFAGESQILEGPATVYDNQFWYYGAVAGPSSFRCRCVQEPVTCQPEDDFDVRSIEL